MTRFLSVSSLVIINLQPTEFDSVAKICIHAMLDDVFRMLMKELSIEVPPFVLRRWVRIQQHRTRYDGEIEVKVGGIIDPTSAKYETMALLKHVSIARLPSDEPSHPVQVFHSYEPMDPATGEFTLIIPSINGSNYTQLPRRSIHVELHFNGNRGGQYHPSTDYTLQYEIMPFKHALTLLLFLRSFVLSEPPAKLTLDLNHSTEKVI